MATFNEGYALLTKAFEAGELKNTDKYHVQFDPTAMELKGEWMFHHGVERRSVTGWLNFSLTPEMGSINFIMKW